MNLVSRSTLTYIALQRGGQRVVEGSSTTGGQRHPGIICACHVQTHRNSKCTKTCQLFVWILVYFLSFAGHRI